MLVMAAVLLGPLARRRRVAAAGLPGLDCGEVLTNGATPAPLPRPRVVARPNPKEINCRRASRSMGDFIWHPLEGDDTRIGRFMARHGIASFTPLPRGSHIASRTPPGPVAAVIAAPTLAQY